MGINQHDMTLILCKARRQPRLDTKECIEKKKNNKPIKNNMTFDCTVIKF